MVHSVLCGDFTFEAKRCILQHKLPLLPHGEKYVSKERFCSADSQWEPAFASARGMEEEEEERSLFAECRKCNVKRRISRGFSFICGILVTESHFPHLGGSKEKS